MSVWGDKMAEHLGRHLVLFIRTKKLNIDDPSDLAVKELSTDHIHSS
jgi:hypothetical protein